MNNLSGVVVTYNEEKYIKKCLESLKNICDEIIAFDSFSTDNTVKILKEFNCTIYQHEFDNHRDQKNRAIEKCSNEWVFLLDSDEYLEDKLINIIPNLMSNNDGIDAFLFPRKNYVNNDGPLGYPDYQVRLFKNYVRHYGHPFHHNADGNAKKTAICLDGHILHEKSLDRQKEQNRLYYSLRPQDYKEKPEGAENIIKTNTNDNFNVYKDYLKNGRSL